MDFFIGSHVIFLQFLIMAWLCALTLNRSLSMLLEKVFEKVYPSKLLVGVIASCFLLIGFVVSFHSEVFTSHDIYNVDKNKKGSKKNAYSWFNLSHVYRFPIEQFAPESSIIQINEFDSDKFSNTEIHNYLFIIDKTGSAKQDAPTTKITETVRKELVENLGNKLNLSRGKLDSLTDLSDVLLFFTIYHQYIHTLKSTTTAKIKLGVYLGDKNQDLIYLSNYQNFTIGAIDSLISNYDKRILKIDKKSSTTDYEKLLHDIRKSGLEDGSVSPDTTLNFAVTLIGDLYHEDKQTLQTVVNRLSELSAVENRTIEQISLFRVPINPQTLQKGNTLTNAEGTANQVELFIKDRFKKYLLFSEIKTYTIASAKYSEDFINSQITQPNKTINDESEISMYFPFMSSNGLVSSNTTIKFYRKGIPLLDSIYITLRSNDENETNGELRINNKEIAKLNETYKVNLKSDGAVFLSFLGNRISEDFYLDFYFPKSKNRINSQLVFRKKLTDTSALCLIFLYTLLYSSMTLSLSIAGLAIYRKASNRFYRGLYGIPLILIPIMIFSLSYLPNLLSLLYINDWEHLWKFIAASIFPLFYICMLFVFNIPVIKENINSINKKEDDMCKYIKVDNKK